MVFLGSTAGREASDIGALDGHVVVVEDRTAADSEVVKRHCQAVAVFSLQAVERTQFHSPRTNPDLSVCVASVNRLSILSRGISLFILFALFFQYKCIRSTSL